MQKPIQTGYRVLQFVYNNETGGVQNQVRQFLKYLPDQGFTPVVGMLGRVEKSRFDWQGQDFTNFAKRGPYDLRPVRNLIRLIKNQRIDLIHCHNFTTKYITWLAGFFAPVPMVFTEHGSRIKLRGIKGRMDVYCSNKTHAVIALHDRDRQALENAGVRPELIHVIHNGVDPEPMEKFFADKPPKKIGTLARLAQQKNLPFLIDAFAGLVQTFPELTLEIAGEGHERANLEALIHENSLGEKASLSGFSDDPHGFLRTLDLFVLTSHYEGLPFSALEALGAGVPVLLPDLPELISAFDEFPRHAFYARDNKKDFSAKVAALLSDPEKRRQIVEKGQNLIQQTYNAKIMTTQVASIYRNILEGYKGR